ncbi:sarcoplasmic reticulum histidine-rich calcium-binding protein [Biomphalaria pfeifferi]|uniref:Sarcoplasmic reticulum histidine-rich calcium-binding protein n=1 Tax=Biomphalaria pfeifferi TaxID=112525 RepID=A0AAD8C6L2_BIOPF|nr:sarcoplasmic reticulum histidine-rich calcium-binding protein [Biomphalaria pfeifferi]
MTRECRRFGLCLLLICYTFVLLSCVGHVQSKPNENAEGVVNMEVQQDQSTGQVSNTTESLTEEERLAKVTQENVRKLQEVDWGQADGDNGWEERRKLQVPVSNDPQMDTGVVDPEHVLHEDGADDHHGDAHAEVKTDPAQAMEAVLKDGEVKEQAEQETLDSLRPGVLTNVHDGPSRTAAEIMKTQQFGIMDIEEVMHEGHHVHGDDHHGSGPVQGGDVEKIVHGEEGVHDDHDGHDAKNKSLSTLDPAKLMHGQDAEHECDGKPCFIDHENPGGMPPQDPLLQQGQNKGSNQKEQIEKKPFGTDPEKDAHGEDHAHEHDDDPNYKTKNKVTYKDIIDLGLSEEQLKGVDLTKLLEQEQQEFENWQRDSMADENSNYWQEQVKDLRKEYLDKIYAKIKHISQPDEENQEWEVTEDDIVHGTESKVEHEMEMWGRTEPKAHRKPYEAIHGRRGENEEQEEQPNENQSEQTSEQTSEE